MRQLLIIAVLGLTLTGCASVGAPESKWQTLANQATTALKAGPVYIDERENSTSSIYRCREMRIELGTKGQWTRTVLSHELSHHILRHCGQSAAQEMEANAYAVTVMETWGVSRATATRLMARLLYINRSDGSNSLHDFCGELRDFLRRFPEATDPRRDGQCQ